MRFVARVLVRPKAEVRDPQGEAVLAALRSLGHDVAEVRTGKEIVVAFEAKDERAARETAERMGDQLLANPVIESYTVAVDGEVATEVSEERALRTEAKQTAGPLGPRTTAR